MRLGLLGICSVLLLTGCTTTSTMTTDLTATPSASSSASALRTTEAVHVPTHLTGEVSRDVYTGAAYNGSSHDLPRATTELQLHTACAGRGNSVMRWQIQDEHGNEFSAGTVTCNGQEQVDIDQSSHFPEAPVVRLDAPATTLNGYAILTGS